MKLLIVLRHRYNIFSRMLNKMKTWLSGRESGTRFNKRFYKKHINKIKRNKNGLTISDELERAICKRLVKSSQIRKFNLNPESSSIGKVKFYNRQV